MGQAAACPREPARCRYDLGARGHLRPGDRRLCRLLDLHALQGRDHKVEDGDGPQILRATTRDFRTFTTPEPWFKADDVPGAVKAKGMIDATVMADKGR